ncbi:hypothetical protein GCG54_00013342 [Colletotrichum gloeosporioides]|uniref:Uncharacterized protein n=1 Tax=Colletotrichum gloeosporioides TaxID=474922 RepID=A0A8H4CFU4_COLGL|nr:uncharacterized protein GCG54_00013342 [Colletotrichum gloeosporioides]KAF3803235.1 hypothetical protein GCG54_00013342 [Colletotrichum gloeosporioides]
MRPLQILILVLQGSLAAEAASWTLHGSCFKKEVFENGNPSKKITVDDKELENAILKGVEDAKAWAAAAASHIKDSLSKNPLKGRTVKTALEPLLVKDDYNKAAGDVKSKFDNIATMKGPVGREGNENGRYEKSSAWAALKKSDDHHFNFIITCRPDITWVPDRNELNPLPVPWDNVRQNQLTNPHDFVNFLKEEEALGYWGKIDHNQVKVKAVTARDLNTPTGERLRIPESINFHPLWIKFQRIRGFVDWTQETVNKVTAKTAPDAFQQLSKERKKGYSPSGWLASRLLRNRRFARVSIAYLTLQFFHLTSFGAMFDDMDLAYGWANNVKAKNRENPDLYSLIAAVIHLLYKEGTNYKVTAEGHVKVKAP